MWPRFAFSDQFFDNLAGIKSILKVEPGVLTLIGMSYESKKNAHLYTVDVYRYKTIESIGNSFWKSYKGISYRSYSFVPININSVKKIKSCTPAFPLVKIGRKMQTENFGSNGWPVATQVHKYF